MATTAKMRPMQAFDTMMREIRAHRFAPIYALMGEESFFIDKIADALVDELLPPADRDFNLVQLYGADTTVDAVIAEARSFPFGAERKVVIVKEAQQLGNLTRLELYFKNVASSTVLVLCHKHGSIDRRSRLMSHIEKHGAIFESKSLYSSEVPTFIINYAREKQLSLSNDAALVMADLLGTDLSRISTELDKLALQLKPEQKGIAVDRAMVLEQVGMSRTYNPFELQEALIEKDAVRALKIAKFCYKNKKDCPVPMVLSLLFKFFSNLMLAYYAPEKTERGVAAWLGVQDWQAKRTYLPAMRKYTGVKTMKIISELRAADARAKGIGVGAGSREEDILTPLVWFILN